MAHILICEGSPEIERLLVTIATRCGHTVETVTPAGRFAAQGDLLLLDPTAPGARTCAELLRRVDPGLPIVCVGSDPNDPLASAIRPMSIVPRPFRVGVLVSALTRALHERS